MEELIMNIRERLERREFCLETEIMDKGCKISNVEGMLRGCAEII